MTKCFIVLVFLNFHFRSNGRITGYSTCSNVLFNKVLYGCVGDLETLHLICRVNNLDIGAFILHNGKEKAQCVSFPQLFCTTVIGNITNTTSGEIFFTHRTKERGVLNGTWTCRNGAGERDDHSSIDLPSNNCESQTVYGSIEINHAKYVLPLIVLPIVMFIATVAGLRCSLIKETNGQHNHKRFQRMLKKIVCLWKCFVSRHDMATRTRTETGFQCFYCCLLFCVYCSAAIAVYYYGIESEFEIGLLCIVSILGVVVAILIPIIWRAKYVNTENPGVGCDVGQSLARTSSSPDLDDQSFESFHSVSAHSSGDPHNDEIERCEVIDPLIVVHRSTESFHSVSAHSSGDPHNDEIERCEVIDPLIVVHRPTESSHTTAEDGSEETNNETENNMSGSNDAGRETIYCETVK